MKKVIDIKMDVHNEREIRDISVDNIYTACCEGNVFIATQFVADFNNEIWYWKDVNRNLLHEVHIRGSQNSLADLLSEGLKEGKVIYEFENFTELIDRYHNIKQTNLVDKWGRAFKNQTPLSFYGEKTYVVQHERVEDGAVCVSIFSFSNGAKIELCE